MQIIAHRGASYDAPENTLAAIRLAWTQQADAVEIDLHLTKDGQLAVIHDDDLRRVGGQRARIRTLTLAELQTIDVGRWKGLDYTGEKVPGLSDVLATVPAGRRIFLELKGTAAMVPVLRAELARSALAPQQIVIIAFDRACAAAAKAANAGGEVCWIVDAPAAAPSPTLESLLGWARGAGVDGLDVCADWPIDAAWARRVHAAGLKLYVWTVDDAARAEALAGAGVDGLTTNRPLWLRNKLAR